MKRNKFNAIFFHYLSQYLNKKLTGKRLNLLKIDKNSGVFGFGKEKYFASFGEIIGLFDVGSKFVRCSEYKKIEIIDGFEIAYVQQLWFDRIIEFRLEKNDGIRNVVRYLIVIFTGKLSIVITDENRKTLFSNDTRIPIGREFKFDNTLEIYNNLSQGKKYCGNSVDELIKNIISGERGQGTICVDGVENLLKFLNENENLCIGYIGIDGTISSFLEECGRRIIAEEIKKCKKEIIKYYDKLLDRKRRILNDLDKKISLNEEEYIKMGEAIIYNKHMIKKGMRVAELPYYEENGVSMLRVKLKENLSPEQNANVYFEKAEKIKSKKKNALKRKKLIEEEIAALIEKRDTLPNNPDKLADEWYKYYAKAKNKHVKGFKYFILESGSHVYVGRNSKENDELTLHFASPNDLFFHVRESPGSHVILRSNGTKHLQTDIVKAASIAAYFSKMRNSKTVPVSYTEIKYVRKPRKAKSGTVVLMREKVIFVSPSIPSNRF